MIRLFRSVFVTHIGNTLAILGLLVGAIGPLLYSSLSFDYKKSEIKQTLYLENRLKAAEAVFSQLAQESDLIMEFRVVLLDSIPDLEHLRKEVAGVNAKYKTNNNPLFNAQLYLSDREYLNFWETRDRLTKALAHMNEALTQINSGKNLKSLLALGNQIEEDLVAFKDKQSEVIKAFRLTFND